MFNSHLLISSSGAISGQYNKTHLFDVEIPERKIKLKESEYIEKGCSITLQNRTWHCKALFI